MLTEEQKKWLKNQPAPRVAIKFEDVIYRINFDRELTQSDLAFLNNRGYVNEDLGAGEVMMGVN